MYFVVNLTKQGSPGLPRSSYISSYTGDGRRGEMTGSIDRIPIGNTLGSPLRFVFTRNEAGMAKWLEKLARLGGLKRGWNGYDAEPPSQAALLTAQGFITHLVGAKDEPAKLLPSVMGGVGITHRKAARRVYVEFYNDGTVSALFTDGEGEPEAIDVQVGHSDFDRLARQMRAYLDA